MWRTDSTLEAARCKGQTLLCDLTGMQQLFKRPRVMSLPGLRSVAYSQINVAFLDETTKDNPTTSETANLLDPADQIVNSAPRPRSRSKLVSFSEKVLIKRGSNDSTNIDQEVGLANTLELPVSTRQKRRTSGHWSHSRTRHESTMSVLSTISSVSSIFPLRHLQGTFQFEVLKIIFLNIIFSLVNKASDFTQVRLFESIFIFLHHFRHLTSCLEVCLNIIPSNLISRTLVTTGKTGDKISLIVLSNTPRGQYGATLLLLNWTSGFVAAIHMLAYNR